MQMIERPWGVTAYGAASVKSMPDLVRAVRQTLRRHAVPDSAVERSRLDLSSSWSGDGPERTFLGFQCQASFAVESRDLDSVQQLLVDLVAAGVNEIEAVEFDVTGKGDMRAEARRQAVAAARRKAELYADAAGIRLGAVVHVEDVDPELVGAERYRGMGLSDVWAGRVGPR